MVKNGKSLTINNIENECQPLLTSSIKSIYINSFNGNRLGEWKSGIERVLEDESVRRGRKMRVCGEIKSKRTWFLLHSRQQKQAFDVKM